MNNINALVSKYDEIFKLYNEETDELEKNEYKSQLDIFSNMIKVELKKEQERGNCSPEFIALCGRFDATIDVEKNVEIDKTEEKFEQEEQQTTEKKDEEINLTKEEKKEELYTLASDKIISRLTGEEIDISNLNKIEKTKVIYYHTDQKITYQDPEILRLCDIRVREFLDSCNSEMYQRQYGENWQEVVAKIYQENYLKTFQKCLSNAIREEEEKIRKEVKNSNEEVEELLKEQEEESKKVDELTKERDALSAEAGEILKIVNQEEELKKLEDKKTELQEIKNSILTKVNTPKTYSDGTLIPDNIDEFGRFTTHRDRTNETGMQERINDAAHVHDELSDMEKARLQRKFEKVFMDAPMYEEEVPSKSR